MNNREAPEIRWLRTLRGADESLRKTLGEALLLNLIEGTEPVDALCQAAWECGYQDECEDCLGSGTEHFSGWSRPCETCRHDALVAQGGRS